MHKLARLGMFAIAATLGAASAAHAQFAKPEDAIRYRQSVMFLQAQHLGRIGAMVKGARPYDKDVAVANAQVLEQLARLPWQAFGAGTDQGGQTRALPAIWKDTAKFEGEQKKLMDNTSALLKAAQTGDLGALKQAFGPVAQTCKSCHDDFRKD
jgi:cytochrome c556